MHSAARCCLRAGPPRPPCPSSSALRSHLLACRPQTRPYHAPWRPSSSPRYPDRAPETLILSAALQHVPEHGFTSQALAYGAWDAGFLPASVSLFPRGPFELVLFHLVRQRLALQSHAAAPDSLPDMATVAGNVQRLMQTRLLGNAPVAARYTEAIALMSLAGNVPASVAELTRLVDDIWYLAGDTDVDSRWYAKRGMLAGVYAASEVFMTQDRSTGFVESQQFLARRLADMQAIGNSASDMGGWISFTASSSVNVLRSWGVRI